MSTRFFLLSIMLLGMFLLISCEKSKETPLFPNAPQNGTSKDTVALKKIAQADSIYGMQSQMNTIHAHGKDLAVHAHQDIPKQRRMMKQAAETREARIAAYNKERERRQARIREMQELEEEEE